MLRRMLPCSIGRQRILTGLLRGQWIVTSWHDYPAAILGRTERPLLDWFAQNVRNGDTWLDIGAHYGYTAIALSRLVGPNGRVFAFEPMMSTAGHLAKTRLVNGLSQLMVLPLALAEPETFGLAYMPTVRGMVDSTLQEHEWTEAILVARFDWLWPQICQGQRQVHGVKIDVQGMEIEVLHGMKDTLRAFRPKLVVEVHQGVDRGELLDLIEGAGYVRQAVPIEPVEGETDPLYLDDRSYAFLPIQPPFDLS
ncbi:FkbM family methyltransferase [Chloroflexota bacterium]